MLDGVSGGRAIAVIGSVAKPLWKEVPRFNEFRKQRIQVWHECGDLDLALWIDSQHRLGELRRARDRALRDAFESGAGMSVANHRSTCSCSSRKPIAISVGCVRSASVPKGKPPCFVPGCGTVPFSKRIADFVPRADLLASAGETMLYRRGAGVLRSALELPSIDADRQ